MILRVCALLLCTSALVSGNEGLLSKLLSPFRYIRPMRPDYPFPRGYYSVTPPPNYYKDYKEEKKMANKENKRTLNDDDVIKLFKHITLADLDKIVEMANEVKTTYNEYKSINNFNTIPDSNRMLPKPINLRDDYAVSHSVYMPSIVKPLASYKVENFGDLPLMEKTNTKLSSVSSYNVPHYSVTSTSMSNESAESSMIPEIEKAPSAKSSAARAEFDGHLKATKIWTHKSEGAAYYLHSDGTLSLEKPKQSY